MIRDIPKNWQRALTRHVGRDEWHGAITNIDNFLQTERREHRNYHPRGRDIFAAFHKTPFKDVRAVIIGQDPYPDRRDATGLAFSTHYYRPMPVSLSRIYAALAADVRGKPPTHGNLDHWAERGILLLNSALTFHNIENKNTYRTAWRGFIRAVVKTLARSDPPIHFMLWGYEAQKLSGNTQAPRSRCHETYHPTAPDPEHLRQFLICQHFSAVNREIETREGEEPIDWFPE